MENKGLEPGWRGLLPVLRLLDGRWSLAILDEIASEAKRHSELLGSIDGVSEKVLTETLRRMERDGLVERELEPGISAHVVYRATELALSSPPGVRVIGTSSRPLVRGGTARRMTCRQQPRSGAFAHVEVSRVSGVFVEVTR